MKLITEPSVYLVGGQVVKNDISIFLRDHDSLSWEKYLQKSDCLGWKTDGGTDGHILSEIAGRICYMSFKNPRPGGNEEYLQHILESGHGSVLEHAVWNFIFTGISRSLTHELIRHRLMSYSELSQRYVDCSDVTFVVPPALKGWHDAWRKRLAAPIEEVCTIADPRIDLFLKWMHGRRVDLLEYKNLTEALLLEAPAELPATDRRKWARQAARSALPNCTETKIFVTANARALRHFIELRGSRHADAEIRNLAIAVLRVMQAEAPALFGDYEINPLADGTSEATTKWRKV